MLHCMDGEYKVVNTLTRKVIIYSWLIRNNCQETSISLRTVINSNSLIVDSPKTYVPSACNFIFYPIFFLSIFLPHATKMRLFFSINHVKTSTRKVITYLLLRPSLQVSVWGWETASPLGLKVYYSLNLSTSIWEA